MSLLVDLIDKVALVGLEVGTHSHSNSSQKDEGSLLFLGSDDVEEFIEFALMEGVPSFSLFLIRLERVQLEPIPLRKLADDIEVWVGPEKVLSPVTISCLVYHSRCCLVADWSSFTPDEEVITEFALTNF